MAALERGNNNLDSTLHPLAVLEHRALGEGLLGVVDVRRHALLECLLCQLEIS